jgi:hypothetical protein
LGIFSETHLVTLAVKLTIDAAKWELKKEAVGKRGVGQS